MSTTSCPRCSGQVTLPVGASNSAQVRCPLCHACYSLADALVNMPPLLEVVEESPAADEWLDAPAGAEAAADADEVSTVAAGEFYAASEDDAEAQGADDEQPLEAGVDDELSFEAAEARDDDVAVEEHDTEVEELSFSTFDSASPELPGEADAPSAVEPEGEEVLEFGEPLADADSSDEPLLADSQQDEELALDFDSDKQGEEEALEFGAENESEEETLAFGGDEEAKEEALKTGGDEESMGETLEFRGDEEAEEEALEFGGEELSEEMSGAETLEFGEPLPPDSQLDDEIKFDLDQPETVGDTDATIEFSDEPTISADDDVEFGDAVADVAETPESGELREFGDLQLDASGEAEDIPLDVPDEPAGVEAADEPEDTKKGKKKKKKKAKAAGDKPKRSWVRVAAPAVLAVPILLYIALWIGFDPIGLGGFLPGFMVPSGAKKQVAQNRPYTPPPSQDMGMTPETPAPTGEEPQPSEDSTDASGEHTVERPATPETEPAAEMPADEPPALAPGETPPAEPGAAPSDPFGDSAAPATAPETPADTSAPADEPLGQPESPAPEPDSKPELPADDSDPFGAADKDAMPAKDEPFAPSESSRPAADSSPLDTPEEPMPSTDDPFAPAKDDNPAPADDPFAPSETATPAKPPADEPLPVPEEPARPIEQLGPRNARAVTPADLQKAMQATMAAGQQLAAAQAAGDSAKLPKARANFYVTLFGMADALTMAQLGPAGVQLDPQLQALEPVLRQRLAADPKQLELLKVFGARWLAFHSRTTDGVVLAGTVESVDQVGKLYHAKVKQGSAADAPSVTIVSAKEPQVAPGDEVVALGSIVEEPAVQLAGYEGAEPAVVWSGMTLKTTP